MFDKSTSSPYITPMAFKPKPPTEETLRHIAETRRLAAEGIAARLIADRLGITRQAVYSLARRNDIVLPKYHELQRIPAQPGLLTGGVNLFGRKTVDGTIGELLVAADLLSRGWHVYAPLAINHGYDLLAYRYSCFITVEVRGGHRNHVKKLVYQRDFAEGCVGVKIGAERELPTHYAVVLTGEPICWEPELPNPPPIKKSLPLLPSSRAMKQRWDSQNDQDR